MAIIYTYPQINSSSELAASDLLIIADMSANGRPTKSLTLSDLAAYITNTGTGSGTTNKVTKWTDGANGVLGDSSITDNGAVSMSVDFTVNSSGNNAKFTTDWGDHRISIQDTLGAYTLTAADLDGGGKIGINKQNPSSTLHVGGTGTFDSSLSIPLIPTANAHATSKQYVDQQIASIPAGLVFQGNWNASTNIPTLASGVGTVGNYYVVSVAGNTNLDGITDWEVGDWAVFVEVGGVDKWDKIDQTFVQGAGATGQVSFWNGVNSVTGDNDLYWDNSNKRLGIGTTSPSSKLHVDGVGYFEGGTSPDFGQGTVNNASVIIEEGDYIYTKTQFNYLRKLIGKASDIIQIGEDSTSLIDEIRLKPGSVGFTSFYDNNSETARFTDGKLGIGTTNPSQKLHIAQDGNASIELERTTAVANPGSSRLTVANNGQLAISSDNLITFKTSGASGGIERMRITNSGNVGIGTSTPSRKLAVSSSNVIANFLSSTTSSYVDIIGTTAQLRSGVFGGVVGIANGTGTTAHLAIDSSGNVGIGDTGPSVKLQVSTSSPTNNVAALIGDGWVGSDSYHKEGGLLLISGTSQDATQTGAGIAFQTRNTANTNYFKSSMIMDRDGAIRFTLGGSGAVAGSEDLTILSGGNVGIGTTSPPEKLSLPDNAKIGLGNSADLQIYHGGTNSVIDNITGDLIVTNFQDDGDIKFLSDNGSGGTTEYFKLDGSIADGTYRYTKWDDYSVISLGTGNDFQLFHDSTKSRIENLTGNLEITQKADNSDIIFNCDDGSGSTTQYFRVDGSSEINIFSKNVRLNDSVELQVGAGQDLTIAHNGSNSFIGNNTGDLTFTQNTDDGDIVFRADDGSGGITQYFRVDGSDENVRFSKDAKFSDSVKAIFGGSNDLQIYHDGVDSYIDDSGTGDLRIRSNFLKIEKYTGETMATFNDDNSVALYFNNLKKFETTSTGTKTTGQMDLAALNTAVANSDDNGTPGEIRFTADYIYVCVADDTWKRVALSTW